LKLLATTVINLEIFKCVCQVSHSLKKSLLWPSHVIFAVIEIQKLKREVEWEKKPKELH
jgi:hypothetical protein